MELCYVKGHEQIACHHFNRNSVIVKLERQKEGEINGTCPICETEYVRKE